MKKLCFFAILTLCFYFTKSQNFVLNNSFELTDTCVYHFNQINYTHNWYTASLATPDVYTNCNKPMTNQISSGFLNLGLKNSFEGQNFAGIGVTSPTGANEGREYIEGEFSNQLINGKQYVCGFYYLLFGHSEYYFKKMGVLLTDTFYYFSTGGISPSAPTFYQDSNLIMNDTINWRLLLDTITANGSEKFITIGNFFDFTTSNFMQTNFGNVTPVWDETSYYYIDNVFVCPIDSACPALSVGLKNLKTKHQQIAIQPNPNNGAFSLTTENNLGQCNLKLYDLSGRCVAENNIETLNTTNTVKFLDAENGVYILKITSGNNIVATLKVIIQK